MSVPLYIPPGSPNWWLSPGIWVTTVSDPTTKVANPIAGDNYTVWVEVENYYPEADDGGWNLFVCWVVPTSAPIPVASIPAVQILNGFVSTTAGPQGSPITVPIPAGTASSPSIVNLQAATTWTPTYENAGHECLIALAYSEQPTGLPISSVNYNAPWTDTYTLAQHNLAVLPVGSPMTPHFQYPFRAYNGADEERGFVFRAWQGPLSEIVGLLPGVPGGRRVLERPGKVGHLGIAASAHADPTKLHAGPSVLSSIKIAPRSFHTMTLAGSLPEGNALIHVTQSLEGRVLGGLSVLVMAAEK